MTRNMKSMDLSCSHCSTVPLNTRIHIGSRIYLLPHANEKQRSPHQVSDSPNPVHWSDDVDVGLGLVQLS